MYQIILLTLFFNNFDLINGDDTKCDSLLSNGIEVYGKAIDRQTRCVHWHSELDIIAIKFKCCDKYYPCHSCHKECADHKSEQWAKKHWDTKAVLCGQCGHELTVNEYMNCANVCPKCEENFNPGCRKHYDLYFENLL